MSARNDEITGGLCLELELTERRPVASQAVGLELRLRWSAARELPLEHATTDIVSFSLFDDTGRLLARADGVTKRLRASPDLRLGPPRPHEDLPTVEVPADGVLEWHEELLAYFDAPPPGDYALVAEYCFEPAAEGRASDWILARSEAAEFTVEPARVIAADVVVGGSGDLCVLARHEEAGRPWLAVRVAPRSAFERSLYGRALPDLGPEPRLAVSAAPTIDPSPLGHRRWVVAVDGGTVRAAQFHPTKEAEVRSHALGSAVALLGPPVQQDDGGLTLRVIDEVHRLRVVRLDAALTLRDQASAGALAARPLPHDALTSPDGSYLLAYGADGSFPIRVFASSPQGASEESVIIDGDELPVPQGALPERGAPPQDRLLAVRLARRRPTDRARVLALSLHVRPGAGAWLARISRAEGEMEPRIVLDPLTLGPEQQWPEVIDADVALGPSGLVAVYQLDDGSVHELGPRGRQRLLEPHPERPPWVRLVATREGPWWLAIDPPHGVVCGAVGTHGPSAQGGRPPRSYAPEPGT